MPHVDDGTLHALLDGALRAEAPDRADRVEAHLDTCADCRARREQAATLRDAAAGVLATLDAGPAADPTPTADAVSTADASRSVDPETDVDATRPDFGEVLARAAAADAADDDAGPVPAGTSVGATAGEGRGRHRSARLRAEYRWTRGLAWAATIVVALGTGYLVRDLAGPTGRIPVESSRQMAPVADRDPMGLEAEDRSPVDSEEAGRGPAGLEAEGARPTETAEETGAGAAAMQNVAGAEPSVEVDRGGAATDETAGRAAGAVPAEEAAETEAATGADRRQAASGEAAARESAAREIAAREAAAPPPTTQRDVAVPTLVREDLRQRAANAVVSFRRDSVTTVVTDLREVTWRTATLEEAAARVGSVLVLPDARVTTTELGETDGAGGYAVRTRQQLPGGVEVALVQAPDYAAIGQAALTGVSAVAGYQPAGGGDPVEAAGAEDQPPGRDTAAALPVAARRTQARAAADTTEQRARLRVTEAMAPADAVPSLVGIDLDSAAATVTEPVTVAVARDGLVLTATGPLPADVLRALLATAAPRSP